MDDKIYEVECVAFAVPKAKHISWAFNGVLIDVDKDFEFSIREDMSYNHIKSILRIEKIHHKYYGTYSCTVINKYGSDTLDIVFNERSEYEGNFSKIMFDKLNRCMFFIFRYSLCSISIDYHSLNVIYFTGKLPIIVIATASCAISLLIIAICFAICCCVKSSKKRELPPADIIPKVHTLYSII